MAIARRVQWVNGSRDPVSAEAYRGGHRFGNRVPRLPTCCRVGCLSEEASALRRSSNPDPFRNWHLAEGVAARSVEGRGPFFIRTLTAGQQIEQGWVGGTARSRAAPNSTSAV